MQSRKSSKGPATQIQHVDGQDFKLYTVGKILKEEMYLRRVYVIAGSQHI